MTEPAETTSGTGRAPGQAPTSPWQERLELGEGPRWVDGRLILVDILSGRLLADGRIGRALETLAELDVPLGAVAPVRGVPGTWIAAAGTGACLVTQGGGISWICDVAASAPVAMRVNDGAADAAGRFWFGTMAYDATEDAGSLYRVERDGTVARVLDHITIPNGPAFTQDGTTMYLADSKRGLVRQFSVDPVTGELGEPRLFADFARVPGAPDGMAMDSAGAVWIACWGGGTVRRYLPDGTPDRVIQFPAAQPTAVCLGGPDGRLLHVTSAAHGLNPPGAHDGAVFTIPVTVPGLPAAAFQAEAPIAALLEKSRSAGRDVRREAGW